MPCPIGTPLTEVETPALLIDLDALERNLDRMARQAARFGVRLRPHAKTHKSPWIGAEQIARGAVGLCCQKVSEAEALVAGGIRDVLVTNEIVGRSKLDRLARLATLARIGVCIDHPDAIAELAAATQRAKSRIDVLVEIDVGQKRCGVAPEAAAQLAAKVAAVGSLRFSGVQAYHGAAQHYRTLAERHAAIASAKAMTETAIHALSAVGLKPDIVGGAGTGTFALESISGVWTEIQPGSYVFMDADYRRNSDDAGGPFRAFEPALYVLSTVMSQSHASRAVLDAGHKALSNDSGFPEVVGYSGASYGRPSDEHGVLDITGCTKPPIRGDRLLLIPGHCDPTVNLYDWYIGIRGLGLPDAIVERVEPISGRGAVT